MKKISVVVPVRNRMENLRGTVKSLLEQTFNKKDFEIIVVDYGGEDDTKKFLSNLKDKRIKYIYVNEKGIWNLPRARNIGIRNSKGELVMCVDGDMILASNVLARVYSDFKKRGESVLYQIPRRDIMPDGSIKIHPTGSFPGDFQASHRKNWFNLRGFDERMVGYGYEDGDLVIRMRRMGVLPYWFPPSLKIYHQYHRESAGEETYVNMLKSKLNFSYRANDEDWGSKEKKTPKLSVKMWRIFDRITILLVIRPIKMIKKMIRKVKNRSSF